VNRDVVNIPITLNDQLSGLKCLMRSVLLFLWESRRRGVGDCAVADLTARVALYLRQVCSRNYLGRVGRLGPYFDFWTMGDRHSTTHLRAWLQQRLLVSQQTIASLDQRFQARSWRQSAPRRCTGIQQVEPPTPGTALLDHRSPLRSPTGGQNVLISTGSKTRAKSLRMCDGLVSFSWSFAGRRPKTTVTNSAPS
jgi:hypothetical protein